MAASATEVQIGPLKEKSVTKTRRGINRNLLPRSYVGPDCLLSNNTARSLKGGTSPLTYADCGVGEWVAAMTADPPKGTWRTRNGQLARHEQSLGISESESSAPPD